MQPTEQPKPAVFLSMASNRPIQPETVDSLLQLVASGLHDGLVCGWQMRTHTNIWQARNMLAWNAIKIPVATHLLFLDDDMAWPRDIILRLLAHKKPIVSGLCFQRKRPYHPAVWSLETGKPFGIQHIEPGLQTRGDMAVGMAATMIQLDVFRQMETHFKDKEYFKPFPSEDHYFCQRARDMALGYEHPIWLDASVECEHWPTDVRANRKLHLAALQEMASGA